MGNDQSTVIDEERKMLESLYQISEGRLDNNDANHVNSKVNAGTSAPNCQPSHTVKEIKKSKEVKDKTAKHENPEENECSYQGFCFYARFSHSDSVSC